MNSKLYRMIYVRQGMPRGTTFSAPTAEKAAHLAELWCRCIHAQLLCVLPVAREQRMLPLGGTV